MDADALLSTAREAMASGDYEAAGWAYHDLDKWITNGGFLPREWRG